MRKIRAFFRGVHEVLQSGTIAQRSFIIDDQKKVAYLIVYKAACSSIMASVRGLEGTEHYLRIHHILGDTIRKNARLDESPDYFAFTFVRNPLERLVSCYESKYHADKKLLGARDVQKLYFDHYLLGLIRKDKGFAHFARMVCRIPDRLADRHFISQAFLLDERALGRPLDFVGKFEDLHAQYAPIQEKYGFLPLKKHNKSDKGNWMDYYDLDTARRVIARYRRDLDELGYRESADALIAHLTRGPYTTDKETAREQRQNQNYPKA